MLQKKSQSSRGHSHRNRSPNDYQVKDVQRYVYASLLWCGFRLECTKENIQQIVYLRQRCKVSVIQGKQSGGVLKHIPLGPSRVVYWESLASECGHEGAGEEKSEGKGGQRQRRE